MSGDPKNVARAIVAGAGPDVVIGYALFLVLALAVSLVGAGGFMGAKQTLADLLAVDFARSSPDAGSGPGVLVVLLATATVVVPALWKNRLAPIAFCAPLLFTVAALRPLFEQHRAQQEAWDALGEFGIAADRLAADLGVPTGPLDGLGVGAWLLIATVIFLALRGIARVFARRGRSATSSSAS